MENGHPQGDARVYASQDRAERDAIDRETQSEEVAEDLAADAADAADAKAD